MNRRGWGCCTSEGEGCRPWWLLPSSRHAPVRWARCRCQVDHVAEGLKAYSIVQENQWNPGEM